MSYKIWLDRKRRKERKKERLKEELKEVNRQLHEIDKRLVRHCPHVETVSVSKDTRLTEFEECIVCNKIIKVV